MFFNSVDLPKLYKNYKSNINADILYYMPHAALGEFHHVGAANRLSCATNLAREPHNISAALWQLQQQIEISAQLSSVGEQKEEQEEEEVHRVESRKNAKWQQHLIALAKLRAKREFGAIN